ncbi:MAG: hypothetical protein K2M75_07485, partial [Clostridia bacterium]|nr:hypothetical protein [Clostridia bacterium]
MEDKSSEVLNEQTVAEANPDNTAQVEQEPAAPQETVPQEAVQSDVAQPQEDAAQPEQTEQVADAQPTDESQSEQTAQVADAQAETEQEDKKKKKDKKKDKKAKPDQSDKPDKPKKDNKVGFYIASVFKYFNIITLLPFALLMYAVFFSSYIVDKGNLFESNVKWIGIIMGVGGAIMIPWFIITFKKRRVCSFDAFLLLGLMLCASMIAQCVIFKNFATFDGISIATLSATVVILILFTIRLIMFRPSVQRNHSDKSYKAKNKLSMYFKVIFTKYAFFIAMLCVIGALLIMIITQSSIFEDFEFVASTTEKIVTMVFAALAAILMIVSIFIRIVRGRANVVDCMPYMLFIIAVGGLMYCATKKEIIYMVLYISIGCVVIGAVWLFLCQYTLLMSNYKKAEQTEQVEQPSGVEGGNISTAEQSADMQVTLDAGSDISQSAAETVATPA